MFCNSSKRIYWHWHWHWRRLKCINFIYLVSSNHLMFVQNKYVSLGKSLIAQNWLKVIAFSRILQIKYLQGGCEQIFRLKCFCWQWVWSVFVSLQYSPAPGLATLRRHNVCRWRLVKVFQSTDAVFPADIKHSVKFVSLNVTFHSFPIGY